MKNHLYLVRHGENWANITKEFSSRRVDYSLTPKGVLQAQQTAEYFRSKKIDAIYSSPLKRAQETAQIIADALGLPVVVQENLREVNVGDLEGQAPTAELWAYHNAVVLDWLTGHPERRFPKGEDYRTLCRRMRAAVEEMIRGRKGGNIIAVGHGGQFSFTLADFCPDFNLQWLREREYANCAITELSVESGAGEIQGQVILWAQRDHLHGDAADLVSGFMR